MSESQRQPAEEERQLTAEEEQQLFLSETYLLELSRYEDILGDKFKKDPRYIKAKQELKRHVLHNRVVREGMKVELETERYPDKEKILEDLLVELEGWTTSDKFKSARIK